MSLVDRNVNCASGKFLRGLAGTCAILSVTKTIGKGRKEKATFFSCPKSNATLLDVRSHRVLCTFSVSQKHLVDQNYQN